MDVPLCAVAEYRCFITLHYAVIFRFDITEVFVEQRCPIELPEIIEIIYDIFVMTYK